MIRVRLVVGYVAGRGAEVRRGTVCLGELGKRDGQWCCVCVLVCTFLFVSYF